MYWTDYLPDYRPSTTKTGRFREYREDAGKLRAKIVETIKKSEKKSWICTIYYCGETWSSTLKHTEKDAINKVEYMLGKLLTV